MTETRADLVINGFLPMVKAAVLVSVPLAVVSFFLGMIIAVAVALLRISQNTGFFHRTLVMLAKTYVSIIRGTPMLVQISVVFYGLPALNIFIDPIPAAIMEKKGHFILHATKSMTKAIPQTIIPELKLFIVTRPAMGSVRRTI